MSYCEHCEGQRFDRARLLRVLRRVRGELRQQPVRGADDALALALKAVRALDIPHFDLEDEEEDVSVLRKARGRGVTSTGTLPVIPRCRSK